MINLTTQIGDRKEVTDEGIEQLQETHIQNEDTINFYWKMNNASSCVSTQRAGGFTLYDNQCYLT